MPFRLISPASSSAPTASLIFTSKGFSFMLVANRPVCLGSAASTTGSTADLSAYLASERALSAAARSESMSMALVEA